MTKPPDQILIEKLDVAIGLLQYLVAIELSKAGVPQSTIGKHLHVAKSTVVDMLRGVHKKGKANEQRSN